MGPFSALARLRAYQDTPTGYALAAIILGGALGLRAVVDPYITIPFVTLFPAMVLASLVGGRAAGIVVAIAGGLISWYFWVPPRRTFAVTWPEGGITILLYALTSTILLLLTRAVNVTIRALERERDHSAQLFAELQHRTANNLQNVAALIRINLRRIKDDPRIAEEVLSEAQNRFEVMSRINRRLYHPDALDQPLTAYINGLGSDLLSAMGAQRVQFKVEPSLATLDRERLMIVSMLIAELTFIAIKHAFPRNGEGSIAVTLTETDGKVRLKFADNGGGFVKQDEAANDGSLGSSIMQGLVEQLGGRMVTETGNQGTTVSTEFNMRSLRPRSPAAVA